MAEYIFEWDPHKARSNRSKHRVTFQDAAGVFRDRRALSRFDDAHAEREERWVTLGLARDGKLFVVIHTFEDLGNDSFRIRIISARRATRRERQTYQETP